MKVNEKMAARKSNATPKSKTVSNKGIPLRRTVSAARTTAEDDGIPPVATSFPIDPIILTEGVGADVVSAPENHPVVEYLRSKKVVDSLPPYTRAAVYGAVEYIYRDAVPTIKTPAEAKDFSTILLALYRILLISKDPQISGYLLDFISGNETAMSTAGGLQIGLAELRQETLRENIKLVDSLNTSSSLGAAIFNMVPTEDLDNVREPVPRICSEILDVKAVGQLIISITKLILD